MKLKTFIIMLVSVSLLLSGCITHDGRHHILRDDAAMEQIIAELGVSDTDKLVVKKPYNRALDCDVYLVYVTKDGKIREYTYEFYGNLSEYDYAVNYYNTESVMELYKLISQREDACMVCVINLTVEFESIESLEEQFSDKHYTKQGYEIIK
ncbi:MAG: hypothetical protein IKC06_08750 [Clostridia bacterium]|nr:hypothetical protein [Clostridia bacterium]